MRAKWKILFFPVRLPMEGLGCMAVFGKQCSYSVGSLVIVRSLESDIFGQAKFLTGHFIGVQLVHGQLRSFGQGHS